MHQEGLSGSWRAYLRHRHAALFYLLFLTLAGQPILKTIGMSGDLLSLFMDLNLLAVALPIKSRKWRWILPVILLAAVLIWVVSLLSRALTRQVTPDTWLEGSVTNLQSRAIYPVPGGVEIQAIANGSLQLSVR